jgi:4-hydroxybenzoyl-CoA reductase alpha subunit
LNNSEYSIVGKPKPRIDSWVKATGEAQYTADITLPRMLHAKILRSPLPHARIVSIDTSKAEKLPGVKGVVTGKDIPRQFYGIVPKATDESALAFEKVRYVGDEVAAVVAVDEFTAQEALELIEVVYEPLPAVFEPLKAMEPGAPLIHDEFPEITNNVSARFRKEFGDIEKGFAEADYIREDTFHTQSIAHAPLEPHAAIATWDPSGKLTLWSSTQIPFYLKRNLAKTLELDESKVRIIKPYVGGGFGGKLDMFAKDFVTAHFAIQTGRPVKMVYTREESLTCTRARHPAVIKLKTGVKKDGSFTAQQFTMVVDGGAYNSTAPLIITLSGYFAMLPYKVPNLVFDAAHVYTNKQANGALRGHGVVQVRFAAELQMDMIAEELGMDPAEFRYVNAILPGEPHPAKMTIRSCGLQEAIVKSANLADWKNKRGKKEKVSEETYRGVGMGCSGFPSGVNNMSHIGAGAVVKIERDGAVTLLTGAADIGQGAESVLAQIAAEELGVELEDIRVTAADTELTPHDSGTFGSGVTFRAGNAALLAARAARNKIFKAVADELEVSPDDLVARNRRIFVKGSPEKGMSFKQGLKAVQYADEPFPIIGRGFFHPPAEEPTTLAKADGDISGAYSFGAQVAEVEVNKRTGEVKVIGIYTSDDSGFPINPLAVDGQIEGAAACGLGQAIYEDFIWDKKTGQAMAATFMDYKLMTSADAPVMPIDHVITNDPIGPFGAKEAGEGATLFTAPAVVNAIYDAIGVWITDLPVTPAKILKALEEKEKLKQGGNA